MRTLRSAIFLLVVAALAACLGSARLAAAERPHIVYIVSDDQGWKDVGFHGSDIKTPNLDALAAGGVKLERFYALPMCTPSRAALLTGRYPHRYGLQTLVIPSAAGYGLPTDEYILPQALKETGYRTAIVGKWHLGHGDRKYWPRQRGFDVQYGPLLGEIDYFTHSAHDVRDWFRDNEPIVEEGYVTQLIGKNAVELIEKHDPATPLFLYLTFTAPHSPYQAPQEYLDRYAHVDDPARRAYSAMITAMDDQIGLVVKALEARKMRENTLIVFQSDNGGPRSAKFTGEVDMSKSTIPPDNGPFRDGKASLYEGGTRVVALANWPAHIKGGTAVDQPLHEVDMYPTLVGLAGVKPTKNKPLDGVDIWGTLSKGQRSPRTEVVYGIEPFRGAVMKDDWKLVWNATLPSRAELFNLAQDPGETTDLAAKHPDKVAELKQLVEAQAREAVPPLIFSEAMSVIKPALFGSAVFPGMHEEVKHQP